MREKIAARPFFLRGLLTVSLNGPSKTGTNLKFHEILITATTATLRKARWFVYTTLRCKIGNLDSGSSGWTGE